MSIIMTQQASPWRALLLGSSGGELRWPGPRPSPAAGTCHFWPQNRSHSWPKHTRKDNRRRSWSATRGRHGVAESNKTGLPPLWRRLDLFSTHRWDPGWPCDPPTCWPCSSPPSGPVHGAMVLPSSRTRMTTWASKTLHHTVDLLVVALHSGPVWLICHCKQLTGPSVQLHTYSIVLQKSPDLTSLILHSEKSSVSQGNPLPPLNYGDTLKCGTRIINLQEIPRLWRQVHKLMVLAAMTLKDRTMSQCLRGLSQSNLNQLNQLFASSDSSSYKGQDDCFSTVTLHYYVLDLLQSLNSL